MKLRIKTLNPDGSVAFDGEFDENEASLILEVGTNYLLQQGVLPFVEEADDDDDTFSMEGSDKLQ